MNHQGPPDSWIQSAANGMIPDDDDHDLEEETGLTRQEREENYWADKGEELYQQNLEEHEKL